MRKFSRLKTASCLVAITLFAWLATGIIWDWAKEIYAASAPRVTDYVSSSKPDQICLTWSDDPRTSQAVQWRTAASVSDGYVQYRERGAPEDNYLETSTQNIEVKDPLITNDPSNRRFTSVLSGLQPATSYLYRVGSKNIGIWSEWSEFTTAPQDVAPFSFVYLGDIQCNPEDWAPLMRRTVEKCPRSAFYLFAGDLANNGNNRNEWDGFFSVGQGVFDRRPLVPVFGNHDFQDQREPRLYLKLFALPNNGPDNHFAQGSAYSFRYSNALFVILDSNLSAKDQAPWLERQLAGSDAVWKLVAYHHPAYSSKDNRDNGEVRESWCPLFDKYHVDMVFQGHDHAYLRTPPMRDGHAVASSADGTIYVIAVSGAKFYKQAAHEYTAVGFEEVATYQVIDIETTGMNKLTYRAYDLDNTIRDEVIIEKPKN
jgi:hypothetical protein